MSPQNAWDPESGKMDLTSSDSCDRKSPISKNSHIHHSFEMKGFNLHIWRCKISMLNNEILHSAGCMFWVQHLHVWWNPQFCWLNLYVCLLDPLWLLKEPPFPCVSLGHMPRLMLCNAVHVEGSTANLTLVRVQAYFFGKTCQNRTTNAIYEET